MEKRLLLYTFVLFLLSTIGVSCNDDDETDDPSVATYTSSSTAITGFNLIENSKILANLDSVFFTIDLENARIYNADSMPKGTDISRMLVQLSYPTCYSVEVSISNAERMNDTTFTYTNSDTIDFTGEVRIKVTALDQVTNRTYDVKVNVHRLESDSLQWGEIAYSQLPSMHGNVAEQKTVKFNDNAYCLMADYGYYVLATATSPTSSWTKQTVEFPFAPDVRSLTAGSNALYILDAGHSNLYSSTDGINWTSCGMQWSNIMGAYDDRVLGIMHDGSNYYYDEYPRRAGFTPTVVDKDFPVKASSNLITYSNSWGTSDISICIGGLTASSEYVGRAWAYDGNNWSVISNNDIGGREGMSLLSYTTCETNTASWETTKFPTLMAWGGRTEDGKMPNTMYVSRDMGIHWSVADSTMQIPQYIPAMYHADALVFNMTMTDDGPAEAASHARTLKWRNKPSTEMPVWYNTSMPVTVTSDAHGYGGDGITPTTKWDIPYIYVFGGYDEYGNTYDTVWRGVLNYLSYKPIY